MLNKVLCIDDDAITTMLCRKVIERASFAKTTITAQNGEEAITYFDTLAEVKNNGDDVSAPGLVLLDLNMPVMNGWDFLNLYTKKGYPDVFQSTKFIVLSSTIDPQDVQKSKNYPIVIDFLSKPISKEMLEFLKPMLFTE